MRRKKEEGGGDWGSISGGNSVQPIGTQEELGAKRFSDLCGHWESDQIYGGGGGGLGDLEPEGWPWARKVHR